MYRIRLYRESFYRIKESYTFGTILGAKCRGSKKDRNDCYGLYNLPLQTWVLALDSFWGEKYMSIMSWKAENMMEIGFSENLSWSRSLVLIEAAQFYSLSSALSMAVESGIISLGNQGSDPILSVGRIVKWSFVKCGYGGSCCWSVGDFASSLFDIHPPSPPPMTSRSTT